MAKRKVFEVVPSKKDDNWKIKQGGQVVSEHRTQKTAWDKARALGRKAENDGGLGQAIKKGRDGQIITEHTYGEDPKKSPG